MQGADLASTFCTLFDENKSISSSSQPNLDSTLVSGVLHCIDVISNINVEVNHHRSVYWSTHCPMMWILSCNEISKESQVPWQDRVPNRKQ